MKLYRSLAVACVVVSTAATAPANAAIDDPAGVQACVELKSAFDIFLASGYLPGLRQRFRGVATIAAGSSDPYLRNATSKLATSRDDQELLTWVKIVVDVCVNRSLQLPGTTVFQALPPPTPAPAPLPPAPPAQLNLPPAPPAGGSLPSLVESTERAAESVRKLTERYRELGDAMRGVRGAPIVRPVAPPAPSAQSPPRPPALAPPGPGPEALAEQAADRHLRRVLEREGATDAKCTKKQYGASWVTVCD
jgi:hypothetical protein